MSEEDDHAKNRFLPILGYVLGFLAVIALLAWAAVAILRLL